MNRQKKNKLDTNLELQVITHKTDAQEKVFSSKKNLVLHGSAGTGKTFITSYLAYKAVLERKHYEKLVYIRSAVPTRNIGFLPGTEAEKVQVYEQPYIEIAAELFGRGDAYSVLKSADAVRFFTTSHVRGITLRNAMVIVDECQNMTYQELDSIITRMGEDCRIFFCGDFYQRDLKETGIREFYKVLESMDEFDSVKFTVDDVVRSPLVKSYLKAKYEKGNFEQPDIPGSRGRISTYLTGQTDLQDSELQQSDNANSNPKLCTCKAGRNELADRAD